MNSGQKVIVCVALGAVTVVVGLAARALVWSDAAGGWFNYAPNNGVVFSEDPLHQSDVAGQAAMWIGLVVLWTAACLFVLRTRRPATEG
jgi:hypothetical protein